MNTIVLIAVIRASSDIYSSQIFPFESTHPIANNSIKYFLIVVVPPIEMAFLFPVLLVYQTESVSSLLVEIRQILLFLFWLLQTPHHP